MTCYPALTVAGIDPDFALAVIDDFSPSAADQRTESITIFFSDRMHRDAAHDALARAYPTAVITLREVDDEDWARRSQENLAPITVGRITIAPTPDPASPQPPPSLDGAAPSFGATSPASAFARSDHAELRRDRSSLRIVIRPSLGFGTGHHATTRLCLTALQTIDLTDRAVLDVGTGSGVLAIAARRLGARMAYGIDNDPDAIQSARDNLALNPDVKHVWFEVADLTSYAGSAFRRTEAGVRPKPHAALDVVTANLTGALLTRTADILLTLVAPGGLIIVSGLLDSERDAVAAAFHPAELVREAHEDEWIGMMFRRRTKDTYVDGRP